MVLYIFLAEICPFLTFSSETTTFTHPNSHPLSANSFSSSYSMCTGHTPPPLLIPNQLI